MEAVRHAQAAQDWGLAARLLADHWPGLHLDGQAATVHALLAGFPGEARAADAELAVLTAADELARGSLEEAERYLGWPSYGSDDSGCSRFAFTSSVSSPPLVPYVVKCPARPGELAFPDPGDPRLGRGR